MHRIFKQIMIFGDCYVGKSCLLKKLIDDKIEEKYRETYGYTIDIYETTFMKDQRVTFTIYDVHGNENQEKILNELAYKNTNAFIIVCSYLDSDPKASIEKWLNYIKIQDLVDMHNSKIFVFLNKSDTKIENRKFSLSNFRKICIEFNIGYLYETSIYKEIRSVFTNIVNNMLGRSRNYGGNNLIDLDNNSRRISLGNKNNEDNINLIYKNESDHEGYQLLRNDTTKVKTLKTVSEKSNNSKSDRQNSIPVKKKKGCCSK